MKSDDNLKLLQQTGNCTYESHFVTVRSLIFMVFARLASREELV